MSGTDFPYGMYHGEQIHRWVIRIAGEDQFGTPWKPSLVVMHLCDNPPCYRFDHLRLGTHGDNAADKIGKGRARYVNLQGERHGSARLTEAQAREVLASSETEKALADRMGVSRATVNHIRRRTSWKHLDQIAQRGDNG